MSQFMAKVWEKTALVLGTGLGLGMSPVVPGTCGSLWGPPLVWCLQQYLVPWAQVVVAVLLFLVGIPICGRAAESFGKKDPGAVVWDELAVFPVVFFLIPLNWNTAIAGFICFRVFDMTKPPPIHKLEAFPGGLGIMVDDLMAAVYAWVTLFLLVKVAFPDFFGV